MLKLFLFLNLILSKTLGVLGRHLNGKQGSFITVLSIENIGVLVEVGDLLAIRKWQEEFCSDIILKQVFSNYINE